MQIKGSNAFSEIKLAEGDKAEVPKRVQILRVGKFKHPSYGKFEITKKTLSDMKSNFDTRVRGIDVAFDYFHESDKEASGWPKKLSLSEDGTELWAEDVDWTPSAARKLAERELRYFSPDFSFSWEDPETGKVHKNVLNGGGLTNRPFVKEMQAIVADELHSKEITMTELETAQAALKLSETKVSELTAKAEKVTALETQIADLNKTLESTKAESAKLLSEKSAAETAAKLAEKEKDFAVLLSEGKACVAQKESFISGNMSEFIKLSQPVNLKGAGSGSSESKKDGEETRDDKVVKLAEEKLKADPTMKRTDAYSAANKEIK